MKHTAYRVFLLIAFLQVASCGGNPRDPDPNRFSRAIARFAEQDSAAVSLSVPVVFTGSSSIGGWDLDTFFPDLHPLNRGFGGSQISDVNYFVDRVVLKYRPSVVVFYAGENDIHAGKRPERVVADFRAFVDTVHAVLPDTDILYLPMKPSPSRLHLWPDMEAGNEQIETLCGNTPHLECLDTATPMLRSDGRPRPEIFGQDSLHMNSTGYTIWSDLVRPEVYRLLERSSVE